jgi:magnesium transporter
MFVHPPTLHPDLPPVPQASQQRFAHAGITWLDILYLRREQADYLAERFGIEHAHIEDLLLRVKRPKLEPSVDGRYLYLVLHFPALNEQARLPEISELNVFITPQFVITTHDNRLRPLVRLAQTAASERGCELLLSHGTDGLLCQVLEALITHTEVVVARLDDQIDTLEAQIFQTDTRRVVREISYLRRDLISLRRIIRPNLSVLGALARREHAALSAHALDTLGNLYDRAVRLWDVLEEHKEIIEGLDATVTTLTSHRLNQEMKTFTLISVIFLPMTLAASVLGMNVVIPFADHPASFVGAIVVIGTLAAALVGFMR